MCQGGASNRPAVCCVLLPCDQLLQATVATISQRDITSVSMTKYLSVVKTSTRRAVFTVPPGGGGGGNVYEGPLILGGGVPFEQHMQ